MTRLLAGVVLCWPLLAIPQANTVDVQKVLQRDFHARGQATMDRVVQDGVQRVCTESNDRPPAELAKQLEADQLKTIAFPEGSLIGDWKRGERIAQGGRGLTWNDKPGAPADGSCYNCHQLSPQEMSHGTLGPSLLRFGATRGNGAQMQRYVYGKIYNAKAYNLCSHMPRLGYSGTLTPEQIKDLVGLLLDPESPVNKR
jgi:L-cysteine S-thiosulfotransferase